MNLLKSLSSAAKKALSAVESILGDTSDKMDSVVAEASSGYNKLADGIEEAVTGTFKKADAAASDVAKGMDEFGKQAEKTVGDLASGAGGKIDDIAAGAKDQIAEAAKMAGPGAEQLTKWGSKCVDKLAANAKNLLNNMSTLAQSKISQGRSAIAKGFQTARSRATGMVENVANLFKAIYVNAGCWGDGHSDFVLVSGKYAVLCSWLGNGKHLCELKVGGGATDAEAVEKIKKFLEEGKGKGGANPTMLAHDTALTPLLADGEPMTVLLGDLHIHLFKESPFDGFTKGAASKKKSLIEDFTAFLDHAESQGLAQKDIIQAGDCFEVWEAQILMDILCDLYVLAAGVTPRGLAKPIKTIVDNCKNVPDVWKPLTDNLPSGDEAAIRKDFLEKASPRAVAEIILSKQYANSMPNKDSLNQPLDLTDAPAVRECIKGVYDDIWDRFTIVAGNHDNNLPNEYLRGKYDQTNGQAEDPPARHECGKNGDIVVEHGDKLDTFNKPAEFDKPNRGFAMTRMFNLYGWVEAVKSTWGAALWEKKKSEQEGEGAGSSVDGAAGRVLQEFARARASQIRTGGIEGQKQKPKKYRLIVMAHSHLTEITPDRLLDEAADVLKGAAAEWAMPRAGQAAGKAADEVTDFLGL
ncbi:MAG: hypothetical protein JXQ75_21045 [Phycisphaerae bacterium]|nr:hypothetical protein [Phycisphaerae bacterium]